MKGIVLIAKALSDKNRIKALMVLCGREVCVCQLVEFLKLAPSTVSKHMSILKAAGLVESRRDEKWIYFSCHVFRVTFVDQKAQDFLWSSRESLVYRGQQ